MRKIIVIPFLLICGILSSKNYYVSTWGNDSNIGTFESPWYTVSKAFTEGLLPGDTVFLRGGTYYYTAVYGNQIQNTNGTRSHPIVITNYPEEVVIWDYTNQTPDFYNYGFRIWNCDYIKVKGIEIKEIRQTDPNILITGVDVRNSNGVTIENVSVHDCDGIGFYAVDNDSLMYINCDSYNHIFGGEGDGWQISSYGYRSSTFFIGCRSWHNSDDAWDLAWNDGIVELDSCWAFSCGYDGGDGNGFKMGIGALPSIPIPAGDSISRVARNCIAAFNSYHGFTQNSADFKIHHYNCVAYKNGWDPGAGYGAGFGTFGNEIGYDYYRNCVAYDNYENEIWGNFKDADDQYNSWNTQTGVTVTDDDFLEIDSATVYAILTGPRQSDGTLPNIDFLKLTPNSDLIDAGVDVGLPFTGDAPDLGWHEYSSTTDPDTPSNPIYVSSVIQNATPSILEISYNLSLANIVPAASAFTVKVNNTSRTVSTVAISGTKVLLTLASSVIYGDVVTVAYNKPASNPLQTTSGGQAATITAQSVTNNVSAVIPVYVSSVIQNATASILEITYNLSLANIIPAASVFTVKVNNVTRTVNSVAISGTNVLLTLASPVIYGDFVTVAYTKPASNPIQTASGGEAASITAQNVINNVGSINQPPVVSISSPTKSTAFIAPAAITIDANASDPDGSVTKVEFYNGTSKLGEITSVPYSYTWKEVPAGTYSLTAAATDNKGLKTVSAAVTVVVEKSATVVNQLPSVSIKIQNEKKPKKHDNVVIIAEASDPDGTISNVELKSGNVTIAEMTTAPYVFTLQNVDTGTYVITAIATDNMGAVSTSDAIELRVEDFYNPDLISLYPNPNNGFFKIDILEELPGQECTLSIISLTGTTVYQENVSPGEISKEISLPDFQSGTYVLMLTNGNTILTTKKFIKQ